MGLTYLIINTNNKNTLNLIYLNYKQNYRWRKEMHHMIERFKHKINELKHHCSKLYKKNGILRRIINNSKPNYSFIKKKRIRYRRRNKK